MSHANQIKLDQNVTTQITECIKDETQNASFSTNVSDMHQPALLWLF